MKKLLHVFLFICSFGNAQNPVLLENTWRLTDLIKNGNSITLPTNVPLPFASLSFWPEESGYDLVGASCNVAWSSALLIDDTTLFYESCNFTLGMCQNESYQNFDMAYMSFFYTSINLPLNYNLTPIGNEYSLVLTDGSGDQAIYTSAELGINDSKTMLFSILPNPTKDFLRLQSENLQRCELNFFNALGQKILSKHYETLPETLDISSFESGIYTLQIIADGKSSSKKIVKIN